MFNINDILITENFDSYSKNVLLQVIEVLRNEVKYLAYRKSSGHEEVVTLMNSLRAQLDNAEVEIKRLKKVNENYKSRLTKKMSMRERIIGRLDLHK